MKGGSESKVEAVLNLTDLSLKSHNVLTEAKCVKSFNSQARLSTVMTTSASKGGQ